MWNVLAVRITHVAASLSIIFFVVNATHTVAATLSWSTLLSLTLSTLWQHDCLILQVVFDFNHTTAP